MEIAGVPTSDAMCMLAESMQTIASKWLMSLSSPLKSLISISEVVFGYFEHQLSVVLFS
jgi:hypothetical protein